MALIRCYECEREISDKATTCPGCGAPVAGRAVAAAPAPTAPVPSAPVPTRVQWDPRAKRFLGTMPLMVKLAMRAISALGWKLENANETIGLVTFETGMSWGSFSGVSVALNIEELSPHAFVVRATGKQNVRGGQLVAFNIGGEAQGRANKAVEKMKELAS